MKDFRPHHESLELHVSIVAKVASKRWGSVTLSPQPGGASTPTMHSCGRNCTEFKGERLPLESRQAAPHVDNEREEIYLIFKHGQAFDRPRMKILEGLRARAKIQFTVLMLLTGFRRPRGILPLCYSHSFTS